LRYILGILSSDFDFPEGVSPYPILVVRTFYGLGHAIIEVESLHDIV